MAFSEHLDSISGYESVSFAYLLVLLLNFQFYVASVPARPAGIINSMKLFLP